MKKLLLILVTLIITSNLYSGDSIKFMNYNEFKYEFSKLEIESYNIINNPDRRKKTLNEPLIWLGAGVMGLCLMVNGFNHRTYVKNPYNDQSLSFIEIRKETNLTLLNIGCITTTTGLVIYHFVYNF